MRPALLLVSLSLLCAVASLAASQAPPAVSTQVNGALTNADVVKMVKAGLGEEVIASAIRRAATTNFRLDPDSLVVLKKSGVSDTLITAMLNSAAEAAAPSRPAPVPVTSHDAAKSPDATREAGIYVESGNGTDKLIPLEPTTFSQGKSGGFFTSAITYGIKKAKWKAIVRSAASNLRLAEPMPTFYFHFEQKASGLSQTGAFAGWLSGASSPNEFVLAKMTAKSRERELIVGEFGLFGASSGTRSADTVDLKVERLGPGVYRVSPSRSLEPGEYCFFYAAGSATFGAGTIGKLFDFGIDSGVNRANR